MTKYSQILLRFSAIFAFVGAFLGSHMAGAGGLQYKSIHAHILVVGWLSLFAWAVYYKVFNPKKSLLATTHVFTAIVGTIGLTAGMWLYYMRPFGLEGAFPTVFFIVGGTILLISFLCFVLLAFMTPEQKS